MATWFTADHHFGHANIIKFAKRPFQYVTDMDAEMIKRWNERVKPGDLVYHLGDFAFADQAPYLHALAGQKILIIGNHDHDNRLKPAVKAGLWVKVSGLEFVKVDGVSIMLCHYGMRVWRNSHHGALHFYGHSHGSLPGNSQSCDVGVDCFNFQPVSLAEIQKHLVASANHKHLDHHQPIPLVAS